MQVTVRSSMSYTHERSAKPELGVLDESALLEIVHHKLLECQRNPPTH